MTYRLHWTRADGQGSYEMGDYASVAEAWDGVSAAKAELLDQCPGPVGCEENLRCAAEIEAGRWSVCPD